MTKKKFDPALRLQAAFTATTAISEDDVRPVKRILNRLGYYTPPQDFGSTHIADRAVFDALKTFQKDRALLPTGAAKPGDDTEAALNDAVKNQNSKESYIWRTRKDGKVRSSHAAREGKSFTWGNPPDGGHPGEDFGCRCWAESVTGKIPIPRRKPNCHQEKESYEEARQNLEKLEERKEDLLKELNELREILKEIGRRMTESLGTNIATFIITLPIDRLGFLAELLRRYFGNIISNKLLDEANRLAKERMKNLHKAEHKLDQLKILMVQLEKAKSDLEKAQQALEECKSNIPGY